MAPITLSHGAGAPGAGASHCPMGTVPRVLVRTVAGCQLGGYPVGRDQWKSRCGRDVPRINIGVNVWGESSIMTDVSTLVLVYCAHRMGSV
jgi:hypothetical protein